MPSFHDDAGDWARYARQLAGEPGAADARRAREADEAVSVWHATAPAVDAAARRRAALDTDAAWRRLAQRLPAGEAPRPRVRRSTLRWALPLTAAVAAAATFAVVRSNAPRPDAAWRSYTAPAGGRATVYLPDGTRAELRARSTLRAAVAPAGPRVVQLDGEAVFTVVHDATRPFRVLAGGAVAEDLGTVFGVRAYAGDSAVRVVVAEGKVAVARGAERPHTVRAARAARAPRASLAAGDVALLDARDTLGAVTVTHTDDPDALLAWSRDRLVFRAEALGVVLGDLGRAYDVRILVPDSLLARRRVTLDVPAHSLDAVLATLATLLDLDVRAQGDAIVLVARGRATSPR